MFSYLTSDFVLFAGKLAPCWHQQACFQRGPHDGLGRSGGPEDPSPVLHEEPATQPGGGGPGGGHQHWDW